MCLDHAVMNSLYICFPLDSEFLGEKKQLCFYLLNNLGKDNRRVAYCHPSQTEDCLASTVYIESSVSFNGLSHYFFVPHSSPFPTLSIHKKNLFIQSFYSFPLLAFTF